MELRPRRQHSASFLTNACAWIDRRPQIEEEETSGEDVRAPQQIAPCEACIEGESSLPRHTACSTILLTDHNRQNDTAQRRSIERVGALGGRKANESRLNQPGSQRAIIPLPCLYPLDVPSFLVYQTCAA